MLELSSYKARNYQYAGRDTEVGAEVRSTVQSHLERIKANESDIVFNCSATGNYITFADNYRDWTGETSKALTKLENMTNTKDFWEVLDAANF